LVFSHVQTAGGLIDRRVEAVLTTEGTVQQSRDAKFEIQDSRPWLPEKLAGKATNCALE
jgi:hypothetical protein